MTNRNSKALGRNDPRPRTPQDKPRVRYPLVERDGEIFLELSAIGGLAVDPARGAYMRVHYPLVLAKGSPWALTLVTSPSLKTTKQGLTYVPTATDAREILTKAAPTPDDVKDSSGDTVTALIQRERDARQAADSAICFARGVTTLASGTKDVTITGIPSDALVFLQAKSASSLGTLTYAITADTLTINSTNILDASTVNYFVSTAP